MATFTDEVANMSLPIDAVFKDLDQYLQSESRVILQAAPGAGKSTRLPLLLLQQGQNQRGTFSPNNQIVILEPRRVAARQIASYLAKQLGEKVGQTVGLAMRGENKTSSETVITIMTDGVLVKMLQADPELEGVGLVVFDEFHERALTSDLALALTLDSQELNESLGVLVMSATIDTIGLAAQLQAKIVCAEGRQYPVDIHYTKGELVPTTADILNTIKLALEQHDSSILVFLSGFAEIKSVEQALNNYLSSTSHETTIKVMPLYGGLSLKDQVEVIKPSPENTRKVVLATNIAQTSLTIDGIDVVVDAGQEKVVQYQGRFNTEVLVTQATSKAAAEQRAGRAGRLRPGVCYRIGSAEHWQRRAAYDVAEIERVDLSQLLLEVQAWGANIHELFWPTQPDPGLIKAATNKLISLGFWQINDKGKLQNTTLVEAFRTYGTELRVARLLHFAKSYCGSNPVKIHTAALLASYLSDGSATLPDNIIDLAYRAADSNRMLNSTKQLMIRYAKLLGVRLSVSSLSDVLREITQSDTALTDVAMFSAAAFPDRVAKQTKKRWKMSSGGAVEFHPNRPYQGHQAEVNNTASGLIVVVDFSASQFGHYVQSYAPLDFSELQTHLPELISEQKKVTWSESKQAPSASIHTMIGHLIIEQKNTSLSLSDDEWIELWLDYVKKGLEEKGASVFGSQEQKVQSLLTRVALAKSLNAIEDWPELTVETLGEQLDDWLAPYLNNIRSAKQLNALNFTELLETWLGWNRVQQLNQLCPFSYVTPAGNKVKIDYISSPPKIAVRLQEMFGEPQSPRICNNQQPLLIELLSPARRPLQLTQDLANFWQNAYVEVKKEMKGRYPKHRWPDDPANEVPGSSLKKHHPSTIK